PSAMQERDGGGLVVQNEAHQDAAARAGGGQAGRRRGVTLSIAIPTGVLTGGALELLSRSRPVRLNAGEPGRPLVVGPAGVRAGGSGVRVVLVRPADVPAYVDHGAADLGIVGKDTLWEYPGPHYELVDLCFGECRLVLAVPEASDLDGSETWPPTLRLATK